MQKVKNMSLGMRKKFLCAMAMGMVCIPAMAINYEKTDNGVTVHITKGSATSPKFVRLQVMGDKIIRVSATADNQFADRQSLIIVDQPSYSNYTVKEEGDKVVVSTGKINGYVLSTTGEVWFTDSKGKLIARDQKGGGKTFSPYEVTQIHADGKPETYKGWTMRQVFENLDNSEAIYGLGQHQADEWNYKGKNEELFQYNTKVSIPFIVSSNNYGILLDNYSL